MPLSEQAHRMRLLRANVSKYDSGWWRQRLFEDALATTTDGVRSDRNEPDVTVINPTAVTT
jgi:trehalose-6-phosphate synthase